MAYPPSVTKHQRPGISHPVTAKHRSTTPEVPAYPVKIQTFAHQLLLETCPALVVPCSPMPVVSTINECLDDEMLHRICPNAMTFGEPTRSGGFLDQGGITSKVMRDKVCRLSLETSVLIVRIPNWFRPLEFYPAKPCLAVLLYRQVCYVCSCVSELSPGHGCSKPPSLMSD